MPQVTVRYKQFPTNQDLAGGFSLNVVSGPIDLNAPPFLSQQDVNHPGQFLNYAFLFWNVQASGGGVSSSPNYHKDTLSGPLTASAWYQQIGGPGNGGLPQVMAFAFSETLDQILTDIPIESVVPTASWPGGNSVSTVASDVDITALNNVASAPGEGFDSWTLFGAGTTTGSHLLVSRNQSVLAIANYHIGMQIHFDPNLLAILETLSGIRDRIHQFSDPSPEDWLRLSAKIMPQAGLGISARVDELTAVLGSIDTLDKAQLKSKIAEVKATITRLESAGKMLQDTLKEKELRTKETARK